jgi:hypothetical protein
MGTIADFKAIEEEISEVLKRKKQRPMRNMITTNISLLMKIPKDTRS